MAVLNNKRVNFIKDTHQAPLRMHSAGAGAGPESHWAGGECQVAWLNIHVSSKSFQKKTPKFA